MNSKKEIKPVEQANIRMDIRNSDVRDIARTLHPIEIKVLNALVSNKSSDELSSKLSSKPSNRQSKGSVSNDVISIAKNSGLKEIEVMRGLQWLANKKLLVVDVASDEFISLEKNGELYKQKGLPEMRLLKALLPNFADIDIVAKKAGISKEEINISIGALRKKAAIEIKKDKVNNKVGNKNAKSILLLKRTNAGDTLLKSESLEEKFLSKDFPIDTKTLKPEEKFAVDSLLKRKGIIKKLVVKTRTAKLTALGKLVADGLKKHGKSDKQNKTRFDRLTPAMLKSGLWKDADFREYDVKINVPQINGGKKQPYNEFLEQVRLTLMKLGFVEMKGPIIETEFWNFDALFQPQNHPARTWTDSYRIKNPKTGDLPDKKIVDKVRAAHENGGDSGSIGWGYKWNPEIAKRLMPRAHDTAISPRYMAKGIKIPGKYFSLVRCFRPDVIDATHGVEFNQMGGIVLGDELSFKHLLGLLRDVAAELTGATEFKFFPDYFPFTEPSVQISAKHPEFGWMELAGAGVFRPELCKPLGIDVPVIAWGFGIDRLAMLKLGIKDIRDLFSHDLDYLRNAKCQR